jgi:glutamate formiminotransferase/glutamate formiminotransferase/formiminotetrahydrofolate cyclodeaminase
MADCVELARLVGEQIGTELSIPVFLYERAASRPERAPLENIRRGGLEGLAVRMREAAWQPDFGPGRLHPSAGACVIGARPILIAYNVNLQTRELAVAKAIAKTVRQSSGGLPCVKAIGVKLASRGLVQVSMNLTDYLVTPPHVAFEAVRREAARQQIDIAGSEVVGLIPRQALLQAAEQALQLKSFASDQILETRLEAMAALGPAGRTGPSDSRKAVVASIRPFLEAVSAGNPTPAGGSVAALAGALACALGLMACRIGLPSALSLPGGAGGKPEILKATEQQLLTLRCRLEDLILADAEAYERYIDSRRLPKTDRTRDDRINGELGQATEAALDIAALACEAAALLGSLPANAKPTVWADLRLGLNIALAAAKGSLFNAEENVKYITKQELILKVRGKICALKEKLVELNEL